MHGGEAQRLRSRATELLFKEDWKSYITLYSQLISYYYQHLEHSDPTETTKLRRALCSALSNRAEARSKLRDFPAALDDCQRALNIDPSHPKFLMSKGKILLELDRYSQAANCFQLALRVSRPIGSSNTLRELLGRSRRLEAQSGTGAVDLSDWVLSGFDGKLPELAEYVGPVQIRQSPSGGRGLFATKNVEAGTPLVITKAVVIGRGILPDLGNEGSGESSRLAMWKDLVDRILDTTAKCSRTLGLLYTLSAGEDEGNLLLPDMRLFIPEAEEESFDLKNREPDVGRILKVLDVNCLTEEGASSKVLGKNSGFSGVGLWILLSFVNHSCIPNARRLHIGDRVVVHASRNVRAGEEITFAYFDMLVPLSKRREMAKRWGFQCSCERCRLEEKACFREELREMEVLLGSSLDAGELVVRLEERMRGWMVKAKERCFLRASFWAAYSSVYASDRLMRKWGNRIPTEAVVAESIWDAAGGDERVLKVVLGRLKKRSSGGMAEMDKAMRMGRGVYGKVMNKQALRALFELALTSSSY